MQNERQIPLIFLKLDADFYANSDQNIVLHLQV